MDDHAGGYREPAAPAPERFPVRMSSTGHIALLISLGSIALTVAILFLTGHLFLLFFFAAVGPGLLYLLSGAPRLVEVRHDAVVIRSWLRPPIELHAADVTVRRTTDSLVFESGDATVAIAAEHFPGDSLERCLGALRARDVPVLDELRNGPAAQ